MRLTQFSDYSLRVLIYVGLHRARPCTIREIADAYGISKNHLMKVASFLTREGYVTALRGQKGGLRLARPPEEVILGSLVRRTEEDLALVECFGPNGRCVITPSCRLAGVLDEALAAFFGVLDQCSLADLLHDADRTRRLLQSSATRHDQAPEAEDPARPGGSR